MNKLITILVMAITSASVLLLALAGTVLADPGIVVNVTQIEDTVLPGETATYNVSVESITTETEYVNFTIDPERTGWTYTFNPEGFDLDPDETNYSILNITVPADATPGDYYHNVTAQAWWMGSMVETTTYHGVKTTVIALVPTLTPIGLAALIGLLSVIAISKIRRRKN